MRQILSRRRRIVVLALTVPITGAFGLCFFMPKSYRSSAVVVVERGAGVSDDDVDARLSALKSDNLRRSRLNALIERFNLYRDMRASNELLIDQMQKDIRIDLDKEERGGRSVAIAVHVTYTASDPRVAADVANDLAAFYEREDLRMREQRAGFTRDKLQEQLTDARLRLDEQETRLKDYKMHHLSELPEQVGLHLSALEQLNSQIRASRTEPNASGRATSGQHQLQTSDTEHDERLDRLRELETHFTEEHPDVKRLKREIAMLPYAHKGSVGNAQEMLDTPESDAATEASSKARVEGIRKRIDGLRRTAAIHEQGILNAPFRQQELEALLPDYVAARTRYQSLSEKYEIAQLWDPQHDAGRLRVLDPAVPRGQAVAPNVPRLMALGIALSLATVVGGVAVVERMDTSFHTLEELRSFTRLPVLASVPRLVTSTERRRELRKSRRFVALVIAIVAFIFIASAYFSLGNHAFAWMGQSRS
jgi:uncharacterized protein involved in exopolysaccharide biosynthesis